MCVITHQVVFSAVSSGQLSTPRIVERDACQMISDVAKLALAIAKHTLASDCTELFVPVVTKPYADRHGKIKLQLIQHIDEPQPLPPYKLSASTNLNRKPIA